MAGHPRILTPSKADRLRRKAEEIRQEKRKFVVQICLIALLMIGAVVADWVFIQLQRHQRHPGYQRRLSLTNAPADTHRPVAHQP